MFEAARAAGTLIPGRRLRPGLVAGCTAHVAVSIFWTSIIAMARGNASSRQPELSLAGTVIRGATAGLLIAALDLAVIGRRYPAIRTLPQVPQWCDHVAFGITTTACLERRVRPTRTATASADQRRRRYPAK